ncbi:MAG: LytTR family DNA-binding domain-containing protein [Anaeromicrobium sp.]|jgi:two-component system LytT family response regulator|uniref:LytR/AlgR family response regulator transcription factor n=1 Tax=Anaeromicrobium sp. TaxID=1929132 RepID=UPI0025D5DC41|nr:LytTR family DNA-binding domain-containing protein [Anaeromicrobium sp.]MCT4592824.1 LytTR family DNA-binding domain-containing protein [Anaeromicrobium sp.]
MNVLICDDDKYTRKMLEKIVSKKSFIEEIYLAEDGLASIEIAKNNPVDIVLMDIDMPKLNGIEAAKTISNISSKIKFIFITAYMDYAIESFSVHPYDYLLKPIDISKLEESLDDIKKCINQLPSSIDKIAVKNKNNMFFISINEILFIEKMNNQLLLHTTCETYTLNKKLVELENILNKNFCRVHRSFIVNIKNISTIKDLGNRSYEIGFEGTSRTALMSRYKFEELKKKIVAF